MLYFLIICCVVLFCGVIFLFYKLSILKSSTQNTIDNYELEIERIKNEEKLKKEQEIQLAEYSLNLKINNLTNELALEKQKIEDQENANKKFEMIFQNLSQSILEKKVEVFDQAQLKTLSPFFNEIKSFKDEFTRLKESQREDSGALKEHIKAIQEANINIATKAQELTDALTKNSKIRGNWGEMLLDNLLEYNGFTLDMDYVKQESLRTTNIDDKNVTRYPDIIVNLPQNRCVVIDSKINLNAYLELEKAEEKDKEKMTKELKDAVNKHIKDLNSKNYHEIVSDKSLDFTVMFMPIEGAFIEVMKYNKGEILQTAMNNKIILASSSTLMPILSIIKETWRVENINNNFEDMIKKLGDIDKKLDTAASHFNKLGKTIEILQNHFNDTEKSFITGRGSLSKRIKGIKKGKIISEIEYDDEDEEEDEAPKSITNNVDLI